MAEARGSWRGAGGTEPTSEKGPQDIGGDGAGDRKAAQGISSARRSEAAPDYAQGGLCGSTQRKDIQQRFKIRNIESLRKLTYHLINNSCHEVNYYELSAMFGITDKTAKKYVDYLCQAFLVQFLPRHSFKSKERLRNQKAYIVDAGLQGHRDNALAPENLGWRLENVVFIELLRRCAHEYLDVYFYKPNPRAKEVDFVVYNQSKAVKLIQVAYEIDSQKTYNREVTSLVKASERLSCNHLTLIAFSSTRDVEVEGKTIHIISATEWLLQL